jgi:type IV pilus assembly protein PilQ
MLVGDGETAVVGGIFTIDRGTSVAAVPFLSKIPVLGWFFKKTSSRETKTELILFVTPRIIVK